MKLLLILLVVLAGVWLWRSNRPANLKQASKPTLKPLEMVRCAFCAVHLPLADGVQGAKGVYCCANHRKLAEP